MYSPNRLDDSYESMIQTPERSSVVASPLRAIATPIYEAVKSAHSKATRDFDRFYGNLQAKLTPRTSDSRIQKRTAETSDRMRSFLRQRKTEFDSHASSRTSLTPLIERHTLGEDSHVKYNYPSRNPFYQESETDTADTPSLIEHYADDTPMSIASFDRRFSQHSTASSSKRATRRSLLIPNRNVSSKLQEKLAEERRRMDRLHKNLLKIRRQSSLLADELSDTNSNFEQTNATDKGKNVNRFDDDVPMSIVSSPEREEDAFSIVSTPPSRNNGNRNSPPPIVYKHNRIETTHKSPQLARHNHKKAASSPIRHRSIGQHIGSSPQRLNISTNHKSGIIGELGTAKLRSAELIRTPGGSQVSNRFWKEIHGLTARKESASPGRVSKRSAPLIKRFTQRANEEKPMTPTRRSTWNNDDDDFWSTGSGEDTIANSFHTRLFRAAQEEREYPEQQSIQVNNSFVNKSLFGKNEEEEDEGEEEEEEHTVHSLFNNKLFKAAQQAYNNEKQQILRKPRKSTTLSEEIATAEKRDNIIKRNNIPTMNANVLAELKAKYQQKLIDDSDAYKFS